MEASISGSTSATHLNHGIYTDPYNNLQTTPKCKPRRLARSVINPKTASEKVMFRRNSTESPLLRLPYEIRTRIWNLVLGERVMHVRLESCPGVTTTTTCGYCREDRSRRSVEEDEVLRVSECACPATERELFRRYMKVLRVLVEVEAEEKEKELEGDTENMSDLSYNLDVSTTENPDVLENFDFDSFLNGEGQQLLDLIDPSDPSDPMDPIDGGVPGTDDTVSICLGRFFALKDETPAARQKSTLRSLLREQPHTLCSQIFWPYEPLTQPALYLLRSCRQVYGEANAIFWSSNTFSFSWSVDFSRFMQFHGRFARGMITMLHLDIGSQTMLRRWHRAFRTKGVMSSLRSLKFLHLYFDSHPLFRDSWDTSDDLMDELADTFAPFRALGLRDATIVIAWDGLRFIRRGHTDDYVIFVERLRNVLMGQVTMAEM